MFKKRKKLSTDLYIARLISLEGEITFDQIYFMLTGTLPTDLYTTIQVLISLRDSKAINQESVKALIGMLDNPGKVGQANDPMPEFVNSGVGLPPVIDGKRVAL